jgi:hypothetical protein
MRLAEILAGVLPVTTEDDGALTVRHEGTYASLRTVPIAGDLELVSLTQILASDRPLTPELRAAVAAQAHTTMLGTVTLAEQSSGRADVMLRYNFPVGGLSDSALQTLVLMALDAGAGAARALGG